MAKIHAFGTAIQWDPAGGSSYTAIGQVESIGGPSLSRDSIDVTTHDNANTWRSFIKGLKDGGEITFSIIYDPALATHDFSTGLLSDFDEDSVIPNWRLIFPDTANTTWTLPGFLTAFNVNEAIDDAIKADITIKVSGTPTLA